MSVTFHGLIPKQGVVYDRLLPRFKRWPAERLDDINYLAEQCRTDLLLARVGALLTEDVITRKNYGLKFARWR